MPSRFRGPQPEKSDQALVTTRVTRAQFALIERRAEENGRSVASELRLALSKAYPVPAERDEALDRASR